MNADGTNQTIFGPPSPVCSPAWAPDGTRIVFQVGCGSPLLRTVDADDGEVRDLPSFINRADWSPGQVWFTGTGSGFSGLHLAATDGPSVVTLGNDDVRGAAWSPDGTRLVYTTGESGGYALVTIGVAGDGRQELAPGLPIIREPARVGSRCLPRPRGRAIRVQREQPRCESRSCRQWHLATSRTARMGLRWPLRRAAPRGNPPARSPSGHLIRMASRRARPGPFS